MQNPRGGECNSRRRQRSYRQISADRSAGWWLNSACEKTFFRSPLVITHDNAGVIMHGDLDRKRPISNIGYLLSVIRTAGYP